MIAKIEDQERAGGVTGKEIKCVECAPQRMRSPAAVTNLGQSPALLHLGANRAGAWGAMSSSGVAPKIIVASNRPVFGPDVRPT